MQYRISYGRGGSFWLTPIGFLILINFVIWIATSIKPELFVILFGVSRNTFPHYWWTPLTCMFIHSPFNLRTTFFNIWHILANMYTLYFFGSYLVRLVGEKRFIITYFIGGILGSFLFLLLTFNPIYYDYEFARYIYSTGIGASGAVFSIAGALTVLRPKLRVFVIPIPIPIPLWVAVLCGFGLLSLPIFSAGIAWQAHLGGLAFGLIMGYFYRRKQRKIFFEL